MRTSNKKIGSILKIAAVPVFLLMISAIGIFICAGTAAAATTIYVNSSTGNDTTGDGTSGNPYKTFHKGYTIALSGDTLNLTGTFTWTNADETGDAATTGYTIAKNIAIQGQGADSTIIQAATTEDTADRRIFTISLGNTVTINSVTIRYGKVTGSSTDGGGVEIYGAASISYSDISYNHVTGAGGGGIDVRGALTIQNSTIHHNVTYYMGGGLNRNYYSGSGGTPSSSDVLDIINCTISYNQVTASSGTWNGGGVCYRRGNGSITNSTIAYNQINNGYIDNSSHGLGTEDSSTVVQLKNNIIAKNILSAYGGDIGHRSSGSQGTFTDNGGNIIGRRGYFSSGFTPAATTWMDATSYSTAIDGTYVLQNGGGTSGQLYLDNTLALNSSLYGSMTHSITSASSITVNNGLSGTNGSVSVPTTDQRGFSRVGTTDIGAYEYDGQLLALPTVSTTTASSITATSASSGGNITADGGASVTARGVCWSMALNPTVSDSHTTDGTGTGSFTSSITGLMANTTYHVRAYATNSQGISYGIDLNFTTSAPTISVTSPTAGVTWVVGTNQNITWTSTALTNTLTLQLARNGTDFTETITAGVTNTATQYTWTVTGLASTSCLIRVTDGTTTGTSGTFTITHAALPDSVSLSPATATIVAGTSTSYTLTAHDTYTNTWDVTASATYSIDPAAEGTWTSTNVYNSSKAGIWTVTASYGGKSSTATLDVTPVTIAVTSPTAGAHWQIGSSHAITWTATDLNSTTLTILLARDGVHFTETLTHGLTSTVTHYTWTVSGPGTINAKVRVLQDATDGTSPGFFTIADAYPYTGTPTTTLDPVLEISGGGTETGTLWVTPLDPQYTSNPDLNQFLQQTGQRAALFFDIGQQGLNGTLTIVLHYTPQLGEETFVLYRWDGAGWINVPGTLNTADHTFTFTIDASLLSGTPFVLGGNPTAMPGLSPWALALLCLALLGAGGWWFLRRRRLA